MKKEILSGSPTFHILVFTFLFAGTLLIQFKATAQEKKMPVKNIVIVHGAFADGSGWEAVYNILTKKGYNVTIVQNPLTSLEDDVTATKRALEHQDGPVILVGHSWGGVVISQAGGDDKVKALVYVAAYIPDLGESAFDLASSAPTLPEYGIMLPDENGIVYYSKEKFHKGFAGDLSKEKASFLYDSQGAITAKALTTPVTYAAWKSKPSYAVVATDDKSINPVIVRNNAKRANAITTEVKASHAVFISQPAKIAAVINAAATGQRN
ncbi:MAG: alpha/beta hydrolase [Chitinophagaceae bacterium]